MVRSAPPSSHPLGTAVFRELHEQLGLSEQAAHILDVAMALFAQKGYTATSVREIVQMAHVTNPMLYYYFQSKEGVFHTLIDLLFESFQQSTKAIFERPELGLAWQVEAFFQLHFEGMRETPLIFRFLYSVLLGPRDDRPGVNLFAKRRATLELVAARFDQAIRDGEFVPHRGMTTAFLVDRLFGHLNQWAIQMIKRADEAMAQGAEVGSWLHEHTSQEILIHHLRFYFFGAGALTLCPDYMKKDAR